MLILWNGHIRTMNPSQPGASAIAIEGDQIVAVGSDDEILALADRHTSKQNLSGKTLWPGLTDAHLHLDHYSQGLTFVDCETPSRAECVQRVAERAIQTPAEQWVFGHGWNQNVWPEGFGDAGLLDNAAPRNPVVLTAKSLHASWVNSAALQRANITATTPDPAGGVIVRDAQGNPNGILLESAMELMARAIPPLTIAAVHDNLLKAQSALWQMGITGVHDFDRARCFSALQLLDNEKRLRLRVVKSIPSELLTQAVELGLRTGFGSPFLRIGSVKYFADGALGPRTAAMLQPYEGEPENTGILLLDSEQVFEAGQQAAQTGLSLAIHAIGDRANHEVLLGYAQLRQFESEHHLPHLRHRIEHVQILHPHDEKRLAELDVIASVQPIHATSDMFMADRFWGTRSSGAYAYGALQRANTTLAFGSDAPVESPNPFLGLHAAMTRCRPDGSPRQAGWYPAQRLSGETALAGFTTGAAFAGYQENTLGKLAPGYLADCIVLDQDPFSMPAEEMWRITPTATMVGGEWVWQHE